MFALPAVADATPANLFFAARANDMCIDQTAITASNTIGAHADASIQRQMLVSRMRGAGLAPGAAAGQRHAATQVRAGAGAPDLWVTEVQSGCTVLIVDWGGNQYSMIHLQPNNDGQFNAYSNRLMNAGNYVSYLTGWFTGPEPGRGAYKNAWLKHEMTNIVSNTGGNPQYYIMVQSMFDASRGTSVQLLGVRNGNGYRFFRQTYLHPNLAAEELAWSGWYSFLPYFSY
jgi:hypothetical protein